MGTRREMNWSGYLKAIGQGGRLAASSARNVLMLGGKNPAECRYIVSERVRLGKITPDEGRDRVADIEDMQRMYEMGSQTHKIVIAPGEWIEHGEGCHERKRHGIDKDK